MVLGVFDAAPFAEERVLLEPGDRVVMFTDGLVEAEGAPGDQFGDDRVIASVQRLRAAGAAGLVDGMFRDVVAFAGPRLEDDATAVVLAVQ
jgi:sigma-B regulation protein RsbU (phosphoserine phosphatase)